MLYARLRATYSPSHTKVEQVISMLRRLEAKLGILPERTWLCI